MKIETVMNQNYKVLYNPHLKKDLKLLSNKELSIFFNIIDSMLLKDPFKGKKLKGKFSELYKFRVGQYRIIYKINTVEKTIYILRCRHRKNVYNNLF